MFYADGGRIARRDHIWFQVDLTVTVAVFRRVGIDTNQEKTKALVCTPYYVWVKCSEAAYKLRATWGGVNIQV